MQSKPFITNLRLLMAAGSFLGFVGGWGMLAQAGALADSAAPVAAVVEPTTVPSTGGVTVTQPAATATATAAQATVTTPVATATTAATATPTTAPTQTTTTATRPSTSTRMKTGGS